MAKRGRALFKQHVPEDVAQAIGVAPSLERQQWLEHAVEAPWTSSHTNALSAPAPVTGSRLNSEALPP
jgi:hypothetical protein